MAVADRGAVGEIVGAGRPAGAGVIEVVDDPEGLPEVFAEWDDLLAVSPDASPYLSRAWVESWWRHFGAPRLLRRTLRTRPHVVTYREGGRLVAVLPWLEVRLGALAGERLLVGIGQETADYGGVLLGSEPERVLPILLDHVESELGRGRTMIGLTRLLPEGTLLAALQERFPDEGRYQLRSELSAQYPYLDLAADDTDPHVLVRRLLKRNDVARRLRRLNEAHEVSYHYHRPGRSSADIATFLELHRRRWASLDTKPVGLFATPAGHAFLVDVAEALDEAGLLRLSIVRADGRPVASRFGTALGGSYQGMKSAWEPDFAPYGPGHIAIGQVLGSAVEEGLQEFDLLRGAGSHKDQWANRRRTVSYWTLGRSDRFSRLDRQRLWALLRVRDRSRR